MFKVLWSPPVAWRVEEMPISGLKSQRSESDKARGVLFTPLCGIVLGESLSLAGWARSWGPGTWQRTVRNEKHRGIVWLVPWTVEAV